MECADESFPVCLTCELRRVSLFAFFLYFFLTV